MTLKELRKKRNLFEPIVTYSWITTLMLIIVIKVLNLDFKAYVFTHILTGVLMGICLVTSFYLVFIRWFPKSKGRKQVGEITFEDDAIRSTHFGKNKIFQVEQLFELKFLIAGYRGQAQSSLGNTKVSDGTSNLVILINEDRTTEKIEFMLESEKELKALMNLAEGYRRQTKVYIN